MSVYNIPMINPFTIPSPVVNPQEGFGFSNIAGGIPLGNANNPMDRYGVGAIFMSDVARRQLSEARNPSLEGYDQVTNALSGLMGRLNGLPNDLISSALGSTVGAQVSAANAARLSGSGGQSRMFAARGAASAAGEQSAALANALVQGKTTAAQYDFNVAGALSGAYNQRAQARERIFSRDAEMSFQIAQLLAGIAQPGSQVAVAGINASASGRNAWTPQTSISLGGGGGGGMFGV